MVVYSILLVDLSPKVSSRRNIIAFTVLFYVRVT